MRYTELDLAAVPDRYVLIGRCMLPTCTVLWYMYMAVSERCSSTSSGKYMSIGVHVPELITTTYIRYSRIATVNSRDNFHVSPIGLSNHDYTHVNTAAARNSIMDPCQSLTAAQCVLLAVHFASESNIEALHSFTPARTDALDRELVLRIVLTFVPESLDPRRYTRYVEEVASQLYLDHEDIDVDVAPVRDLSDDEAQKRVRALRMLSIDHLPSPYAPQDLLTRFVYHRAHRIDRETGLLHLTRALVEPFLPRNDFIRTWYIGACVPLLRLPEYYPEDDSLAISLSDFEQLHGRQGVDMLLSKSGRNTVARDIKGKQALSINCRSQCAGYNR